MKERDYQAYLIKEITAMLPGCVILKNDPSYLQGFPDLTIFFHDKWAVLEVKVAEKAAVQVNQAFYIDRLREMSFAAFIYPENEEEVLNALQYAFQPRRPARIPRGL